MNLRMYGFYDKITKHKYVSGEPYVNCYDDSAVQRVDTPDYTNIALMIEPRTIMPLGYEFLEKGGWKHFKYVYTHDSRLLDSIPNAKLILVGAVWGYSDVTKSKFCSLCCSFKEMCELHMARKELAYKYTDNPFIDVYGDYMGKGSVPWVLCSDYLKDYRFSIIIENNIDDYYFTEKILNCFAHKVIPVYWGARKIDEYFNKQGIFHVESKADIEEFVDIMTKNPELPEMYYDSVKNAIDDNYKRVRSYSRFEDWLFSNYGDDLEQMK